MKIKPQTLSFLSHFVLSAVFSGFFLAIFMIVTAVILYEFGIKTLLGIHRHYFLFVGLALLSVYILGVLIFSAIEKFQVRSLKTKKLKELVTLLRNPHLELEKLVQIVEVITRKKNQQTIPYILKALEELINRIERNNSQSLSFLSLAIFPILDSLVILKANTRKAHILLNKLLILIQDEYSENEKETEAGTLLDDLRNSVSQAIEKISQDMKKGKSPEGHVQLPWTINPLKGLNKIMAYAAGTFLFFSSLFIIAGLLSFSVTFITTKKAISLIGALFFLILIFFVIKAFLYINLRLELPRMGKFTKAWGGKSSVYHMFELKLRGFEEFSKINFRKDGMYISGNLSPSWLPIILFIIIINLLFVIFGLTGNYRFFFYELILLLPVVLIYYLIGKKKKTIIVQPENIREVILKGPIMKIKFIEAPVSQLKKVKFLVPPSFQVSFFSKFDKLFPGVLPEQYHIALKQITP